MVIDLPANRALHLIDVENLAGGTEFDELDVIEIENLYRGRVAVSARDHVVIASSHHTAPAAWFGWSPARRLVNSGPNGADEALLEVIRDEGVERRFERVVIASGDGIFATPAAMLQQRGVSVSIVARQPGCVSRRLAFAVRSIIYLDRRDDLQIARAAA